MTESDPRHNIFGMHLSVKEVIDQADLLSEELGHRVVGVGHLFLALFYLRSPVLSGLGYSLDNQQLVASFRTKISEAVQQEMVNYQGGGLTPSAGEAIRFAMEEARLMGLPQYDGYCILAGIGRVNPGFLQESGISLEEIRAEWLRQFYSRSE